MLLFIPLEEIRDEFYTLIITSDGTNSTLRIYDKDGVAKDINGTTSGFTTTSLATSMVLLILLNKSQPRL